jgi:transposase
LDRPVPYPAEQVRSVTLVVECGRLFVDVTAEVPIAAYSPDRQPDPERVAGVDPGVIHPFAVAGPEWARQRELEGRHQRRVRQAQHEAAKTVIGWAVARRIGTPTVGDPRGVLALEAGRRHNRRVNFTSPRGGTLTETALCRSRWRAYRRYARSRR